MFNTNSLNNIIQEQYYLTKYANISISESNLLPDFEREIYINMVINDLKNEAEQFNKGL